MRTASRCVEVRQHPSTRYAYTVDRYRTGLPAAMGAACRAHRSRIRSLGLAFWMLRKGRFHQLRIYLQGWRAEPNFRDLESTGHGTLRRCGFGFTRSGALRSLEREMRRAYREENSGAHRAS